MSTRQIFAALIFLIGATSSCGTSDHHREIRMDDAAKLRYQIADSLDEEALEILDQAEQVSTFEVARPRPPAKQDDTPLAGGAPVIAEGPDLDADAIKELRGLIFSDLHYTLDRKKRVPFVPQVAFVLQSEQGKVTVLAALFTAQLRFVFEDKQLTVDCDPIIDKWRQFAAQFIEVQGLDEIPE